MHGRVVRGLAGAACLGAIGWTAISLAAGSNPPKARYEMDVSTTSGMMGGMAMGGGGGGGQRMNPMAMLRGGAAPSHQLTLRLGSTLAPAGGGPHADHFMPDGMQLGASVPLETPQQASYGGGPSDERAPQDFRRPKARLLIFWGCGAHAGPGQPVIIDFSKIAAGQMPPNLFSSTVPIDRGPSAGNSRTYGEWPNSRSSGPVRPEASLLGQHRVAGNYSPDIAFSLNQDFMPAIQASSADAGDGSTRLSWNAVQGATGYYAWLMGARSMGQDNADMVWWTSASRQEFGAGLTDWLAPGTVSRLIGEHVVMPPSQTSCTVPAEVKQAGGQFMMAQLYAYGPEADFAYPPRPANPRLAWNPDWTARVRYRSSTGFVLGMPNMGGMGGRDDEDGQPANAPPPKKKCRPSIGGLLGGRVC